MIHSIIQLSIEDTPAYADVIRRSFETAAKDYGLTIENCPEHWSFKTNEQLADKFKEGYYPFGYYIDDKIVGFASLTDLGKQVYELNVVSVIPEYRHRGYGRALIDFYKAKVKELGGCKITISLADTDVTLKKWYINNGFIHTETKTFDNLPLPVGYMEWIVSQEYKG